jgi:sugar O-acyltransferase (sialic acid O-acetyltransferase NeuD family)
MNMNRVVLFGTEKMAEVAHFYLSKDSPYDVVAFTADTDFIRDKQFRGLPVVPFEEIEKHYPADEFSMFIAIGYKNLNAIRANKYKEAKDKGYRLISYINSRAVQWGEIEIGDNCFILENQVIQPWVKIGNDVILWSGNHFGHNVIIGDHCWISSHVVVSGGVSIGPRCFLGVNATIKDDVSIGKECIIGAGALILNDVIDNSVYVATPTELYPLDSTRFERMMENSR